MLNIVNVIYRFVFASSYACFLIFISPLWDQLLYTCADGFMPFNFK